MSRTRYLLLSLLVGVAVFVAMPGAMAHDGEDHTTEACTADTLFCPVTTEHQLVDTLAGFPTPNVTPPASPILVPAMNVRKPVTGTVTYDVTSKGVITADFAQFKQLAAETYANSQGWVRLGVEFKEVASGGRFTLVLAEAGQMTTFGSSICDQQYSCQVGRYVIINQDRWQGATTAWNDAGGDLRNYRHMVVNHETGHWLGHGHTYCGGAGKAATVMMQQSISLSGCKFNPWPQDSEIWSTTLGIK